MMSNEGGEGMHRPEGALKKRKHPKHAWAHASLARQNQHENIMSTSPPNTSRTKTMGCLSPHAVAFPAATLEATIW